MKRTWKGVAGMVAALGSFFIAATAFAQTVTLANPLGSQTFPTIVTNVVNFLLYVAVVTTTIMVLVGAFQMMTSAGDPEKFGKGKKTLMYATIGFAIAFLATGVVSIIQSIINGK